MQERVYFGSDFHLGAKGSLDTGDREKQVVRWLTQVGTDAKAIYLVGDLFDFWFEYKSVIPKGFTRFLGTLAELRDQGVPIHVFTGNHDLWMFGYFEAEFGIPVYRNPIQIEIQNRQFFIGHGDGLGPGDRGYKLMKKVFVHPVSQWMFGWFHPDLGTKLANFSSQKSREATPEEEFAWLGEDREWLLQYCNRKIELGTSPDYFIFGHRHLAIDWVLKNGKSRYINLGEWIHRPSYAVFDGNDLQIQFFENKGKPITNR